MEKIGLSLLGMALCRLVSSLSYLIPQITYFIDERRGLVFTSRSSSGVEIIVIAPFLFLLAGVIGLFIGYFRPRPIKMGLWTLVITLILNFSLDLWWAIWATYYSDFGKGTSEQFIEKAKYALFNDGILLLIPFICLSFGVFVTALLINKIGSLIEPKI